MENTLIECSCHSLDHVWCLSFDDEDNSVFSSIHLHTGSFLMRIHTAIKYIFGYKSRYGCYGEFLIDREQADKIIEVLKKIR